jgi:hypothetical protein
MPLAVANFDNANGADIMSAGRFVPDPNNPTDYQSVVEVLMHQSGSTFDYEAHYPTPPYVTIPSAIAVSRFQTGSTLRVDAVVATRAGPQGTGLFVMLRDANGWTTSTESSGGVPTAEMAAGILQQDQTVRDLVLSYVGTDDGRVSLNQGEGTFQINSNVLMGLHSSPPVTNAHGVATGALNDDLAVDVAIAYQETSPEPGQTVVDGGLCVFLGNGCGGFQGTGSAPYFVDPDPDPNAAPSPWFVRIADMNGDGRNDLIASCNNTHKVSVILNDLPPP